MPIYKARPLTKNLIKRIAFFIRKQFGIEKGTPFPVISFIETCLSGLRENDYTFVIVDDKELKENYAETDVKNKIMRIRQSVYDKECLVYEIALKILKHELGHYFLHDSVEAIFPKNELEMKVRKTEDPEWQADVFADYI